MVSKSQIKVRTAGPSSAEKRVSGCLLSDYKNGRTLIKVFAVCCLSCKK